MRSAHLNVRLFDPIVWDGTTGFEPVNIGLAFILTLTMCIGHASVASWQGAKIIQHERGRTFFTSSIARAVLIVSTVLTIFEPLVIFLVLPMVAWSWVPAHSKWLPSGMTQRLLRRTEGPSEVPANTNVQQQNESEERRL